MLRFCYLRKFEAFFLKLRIRKNKMDVSCEFAYPQKSEELFFIRIAYPQKFKEFSSIGIAYP